MDYFFCLINIYSDKSLEEVAELISNEIFGGIVLGGKDKRILDEVPAVFTDALLGLRIVLYGYGGNDGYVLQFVTRNFPWDQYPDRWRTDLEVNISKYIAWLLRNICEMHFKTK